MECERGMLKRSQKGHESVRNMKEERGQKNTSSAGKRATVPEAAALVQDGEACRMPTAWGTN